MRHATVARRQTTDVASKLIECNPVAPRPDASRESDVSDADLSADQAAAASEIHIPCSATKIRVAVLIHAVKERAVFVGTGRAEC